MMKKALSLLLAAATILSLAACGAKPSAEPPVPSTASAAETAVPAAAEPKAGDGHYPVSIRYYDYARNHVEMVFEKAPERVLTYSLNSVENMIALGLEDKIIMAMSVSPEEILPKYREAFDRIQATSEEFLSKEDVLALQPDFILAWYSSFDDKRLGDVPFWNERGIKTYMAYNSACAKDEDYEYVTNDYIEREYLDILNLGKIFHVEDRAEALVAEMRATVAKGQEYASKAEPKNIVIIEDEGDGFRIYGEDTIGGQIAAAVGANLLAKTRKERKSAEDLVVLNPDYVFGVHFGPDSASLNDKNCLDCFQKNPALQNISAYKNDNLIPTDLTMVYAPGVRILESFQFFIDNLYPEMAGQDAA